MGHTLEQIVIEGAGGVLLRGDAIGREGDPPVVLLHGGGQTRNAWHGTLEVLGQSGWRAYAFDLRGHGESDWAEEYGIELFAVDVKKLAEAFDRPALVGASLGGVASLLALGGENGGRDLARALVLVDVAPRIEPDGAKRVTDFMRRYLESGFADLEEVLDALQEYNPHRPRPKDTSGLEKNLRRGSDGRWYWHWDPSYMSSRMQGGQMPDDNIRSPGIDTDLLQQAAASLAVPTLLVRGRMSDLLSEEGAAEMLALTPHASFVDVAGAGHMVAGDRNDAFNDAVVDFLASVRAGS